MRHVTRFATLCALLIGALALGGCGDDGGIVGTWTLDKDKAKESMKTKGIPDGMIEMFMKMDMTVTVDADGTYVRTQVQPTGTKTETKGTWKAAGDGWQISPTQEDGKALEDRDPFPAVMQGGQLVVTPDKDEPDMKMYLNRK